MQSSGVLAFLSYGAQAAKSQLDALYYSETGAHASNGNRDRDEAEGTMEFTPFEEIQRVGRVKSSNCQA